jgi:RHS repeat-associated protein
VRKYDYDIGRFTSIDPLFEKYAGWSPYYYFSNNLVNMVDGNGRNFIHHDD